MLAWMKELIDTFLSWVYGLMPISPFAPFISKIADLPYLNYLNWFVPVKQLIIIGKAWLGAIFLGSLYGLVLRVLKAIEKHNGGL